MRARGAGDADVEHAAITATAADLQDNDRWSVTGGTDLDGDDLTLIVAVEANCIVWTIY